MLTDGDAVGDFAAEVIDEDGERLVGEGFVEHLGRAHGGAGVADQRVRHGAAAFFIAEPVGGGVVGVADEPCRAFVPGDGAADRGGVGHHLLHLGPGAVARVHGEEAGFGQGDAHLERVVRGHAGRADFLQHDRFEVGERDQAAGDVDDRLAGADPGAFGVAQVELEFLSALVGDRLQPFQHQARRRDDGAAHEDGVGDALVAEALHHFAGVVEVGVGARGDVGTERPARRRRFRHWAATDGACWAGRRRAFNSSATRKASSSACSALRRGSQKVS